MTAVWVILLGIYVGGVFSIGYLVYLDLRLYNQNPVMWTVIFGVGWPILVMLYIISWVDWRSR